MSDKFLLTMSQEQNAALDQMMSPLKASSRAEVIRKALALAEVYAMIQKDGNRLGLVDESNNLECVLTFK